jgi:hypothetical protein
MNRQVFDFILGFGDLPSTKPRKGVSKPSKDASTKPRSVLANKIENFCQQNHE